MPHGGITSQYKSRLGAPEARLFAERPARTVVQKAHNSSRNWSEESVLLDGNTWSRVAPPTNTFSRFLGTDGNLSKS